MVRYAVNTPYEVPKSFEITEELPLTTVGQIFCQIFFQINI